jgi:hypothetical protein
LGEPAGHRRRQAVQQDDHWKEHIALSCQGPNLCAVMPSPGINLRGDYRRMGLIIPTQRTVRDFRLFFGTKLMSFIILLIHKTRNRINFLRTDPLTRQKARAIHNRCTTNQQMVACNLGEI